MSQSLQVLESRKKELHTILVSNKSLVNSFSPNETKKFSENFIELANNEYLMKVITDKKLILRLAVSLTKQGIDIHPSKKQCYIVPFDTKIDGQKVMIPQEIIPLKGWQQKSLKNGFLLRAYQVWNIGGQVKSEKDFGYEQLVQIDDTDVKFRDENFYGWDIELSDLSGKLPLQKKFVSFKYAKIASKNMSTPKEFLLQGLVHKAVRRAVADFAIPSDRDFDISIEPISVEVVESEFQSDPMDSIDSKELTKDKKETKVNFNDI